MRKLTFHLISLGCAKNTVDSSSMAQLLTRSGYIQTPDPGTADLILVNTCGFIQPARDESYAVLKELGTRKKPGQLLVAAGCLTQRYGEEVLSKVPGLDGILGTRRWMDIIQVVDGLRDESYPRPFYHLPDVQTVGSSPRDTIGASIQGGSAYLKIADGCRRPCAFCAIPQIKGRAVSRPQEEILSDARFLRDQGVREINLIAQDTTDYGYDLGMTDGLATLLKALGSAVPDVDWIRILYAYPGYVSDGLIEVMAQSTQILPYLDLPLQHADPEVLRMMRRPSNLDWVYRTIDHLRQELPGLALRTTFIVGYPGETDQAFETLLDFVREMRFDKVGAFEFSFESSTPSAELGDPISPQVKSQRLEQLMLTQQRISLEINRSLIGSTLPVLFEGQGEIDGSAEVLSLGRSYRDAPEIDGMVLVEGEIPQGEIRSVRITGAMPYDLSGIPASTGS
jgi:ribosomal protein S12 methylthiotransferase